MDATIGAFDRDWNVLEATGEWPSEAAERLHKLVEKKSARGKAVGSVLGEGGGRTWRAQIA